ncbi:MAG: MBL fold metallo-hydrolase [Candidatus Thermoplasmatota archaeon]|nr:MBL fold metallo-hydrolase [Candidatus Thermoplasmatota archaeon]
MKLTIVYDNVLFSDAPGLKSDHGFSCLIETDDGVILFDTGAKGDILLSNIKILGIDPSIINKIVISHEHWDHNGGLESLVPLVGGATVYRLVNENLSKNVNVATINETKKIAKGIFTTGRLKGMPVDEQALILKNENGCYVLAGCSHPGVEKIFDAAKQYSNIVGLIGGLHGFNNFSVLKDLDFICPCHCTTHKHEIRRLFSNTSCKCGVGKVIDLDVKI